MRFTSFVVFLILASSALRAQSKADVTPLISDASQFVSGAGAYASNLIDGNASTVWLSTGPSVTVRLPYGVTNGTPFRIRFTVPAGVAEVPTAFAVYGLHDDYGELKSETAFGYTNERISYDGKVEYESPTFYVRGEFRDRYWDCTHLRFDCTETLSDVSSIFSLAEFQIVLYNEYIIGDGAMLRNDGDIVNVAENRNVGAAWYKPLVDEIGHSCWSASDNSWIWQGYNGPTGLIVTPQAVAEPTHYILKIGRPAASVRANGFPTDMKWSYQSAPGAKWIEGGHIDLSDVSDGEIRDVEFIMQPEYYRLKFETIANVGNECLESWAGGMPNTVLSRFQLYGPIKVYTTAPDPLPNLGVQYPNPNKVSLNQTFFKNRLYSQSLSDFRFEHTHGIVDKQFDNNFNSDGGWLRNLDIWDADGHLVPGFEVPGAELGVSLPDFSYDARVNSSEVRPDGGDFKRQSTTTVFHEVLVIPGERVDLIPIYGTGQAI
ncbi:MAG: hypothetical protein K2F78_04280 [Muribaculaceae bacterium]|nr:hypothetical protein [Muribaculaceae bacterium]